MLDLPDLLHPAAVSIDRPLCLAGGNNIINGLRVEKLGGGIGIVEVAKYST